MKEGRPNLGPSGDFPARNAVAPRSDDSSAVSVIRVLSVLNGTRPNLDTLAVGPLT